MQNAESIYLGIAEVISRASYAQRAKVGAIIVKDDNIIAFGYNGTPAGFNNVCEFINHDTKEGRKFWVTKPEVLHAESNALAKCAKSTHSSDGAVLYTTMSPCFNCAKMIIQSGIIKVVYAEQYRDESGIILLSQAGITVYKHDLNYALV